MKQSPSEASSHAPSQETPRLLWSIKFYYHAHKSPPLVPILSQMNPVHALLSYFFKIYSDIIFPSTHTSFEWSLFCRFFDQNYVRIFLLPIRATSLVHLILFDLITLIVFGEAFKLQSSSLCSFLQPSTTSSLLDGNILRNLFSNNLRPSFTPIQK